MKERRIKEGKSRKRRIKTLTQNVQPESQYQAETETDARVGQDLWAVGEITKHKERKAIYGNLDLCCVPFLLQFQKHPSEIL